MMDETTLQTPVRHHGPEVYRTRQVIRLVQRQFHREGFNVCNLIGDIEAMLSLGYGLEDRDKRHLTHILKCCIREADTMEGVEVSMSDRQWKWFVTARRRFLNHPDYLTWQLKARLPAVAEASPSEL
jgi:hypothetical protein